MQAKIQIMTSYLCNNGDVTNDFLLLCRIYEEYMKLDTCAKFDDHQRNNNKVMIGGKGCVLMTDVSEKPMSNRVNGARFFYNF